MAKRGCKTMEEAEKAKKIASSYPFTSIETKSPGLFV